MKRPLIFGVTLGLAGCTTLSAVTLVGPDTYFVRVSNPGGFRTNDEMLEDAGERADHFCGKHGERTQVVAAAGGEGESAADLTFRCVPK